jgi:hypothetical protein
MFIVVKLVRRGRPAYILSRDKASANASVWSLRETSPLIRLTSISDFLRFACSASITD